MSLQQQAQVNRLALAIMFGFSGVSMTLAGAFMTPYSLAAAVATTALTVAVAYQRPGNLDELQKVEREVPE